LKSTGLAGRKDGTGTSRLSPPRAHRTARMPAVSSRPVGFRLCGSLWRSVVRYVGRGALAVGKAESQRETAVNPNSLSFCTRCGLLAPTDNGPPTDDGPRKAVSVGVPLSVGAFVQFAAALNSLGLSVPYPRSSALICVPCRLGVDSRGKRDACSTLRCRPEFAGTIRAVSARHGASFRRGGFIRVCLRPMSVWR